MNLVLLKLAIENLQFFPLRDLRALVVQKIGHYFSPSSSPLPESPFLGYHGAILHKF